MEKYSETIFDSNPDLELDLQESNNVDKSFAMTMILKEIEEDDDVIVNHRSHGNHSNRIGF